MNIRIGNDIHIHWDVLRQGEPETFEGKSVEVRLSDPNGAPVPITIDRIATGEIDLTFEGRHQKRIGNYCLLLVENPGMRKMNTLDQTAAFTLVPRSACAGGRDPSAIRTETVSFTSNIQVPADGRDGKDGKSAYEVYCEVETAAGRTPLGKEEWAEGITLHAGTGIRIADGTINHSNAIGAGSAGGTDEGSGGVEVPVVSFDAEGHVTAADTVTTYPPTTPGEGGQYWRSEGQGQGAWQTGGEVAENEAAMVSGDAVFRYLQENGTTVVLNDDRTTLAEFYAPTACGNATQLLASKGFGNAPAFARFGTLEDDASNVPGKDAFTTLTLGNPVPRTAMATHAEGCIVMNSAGTASHKIVGKLTSTAYTHTLPNSTGYLVSKGSTDGYPVGGDTKPAYISAEGVATACTGTVGSPTAPVYMNGGSLTACGDELLKTLFDMMHPVGSVYIAMQGQAPTLTLADGSAYGTWVQLADGYFLESTAEGGGATVEAGLPDISGGLTAFGNASGAFHSPTASGSAGGGTMYMMYDMQFSASHSNALYGKSDTVQPPAIEVVMYRRIT